MKTKILFVCLGNICRSPAADGVLRQMAHRAGRDDDFYIDSAGIGDWHIGQLPDPRMRACGARHGYDFTHRARQFQTADFDRFDLIMVMDCENYRAVTAKARNHADAQKVHMLADYLTDHPGTTTIPDPYFGDAPGFDYALELIEDACRGLLARYPAPATDTDSTAAPQQK